MFQTTKKAANYFIALQYAQIDEEPIETSVQTQNEAHNDFDKGIFRQSLFESIFSIKKIQILISKTSRKSSFQKLLFHFEVRFKS